MPSPPHHQVLPFPYLQFFWIQQRQPTKDRKLSLALQKWAHPLSWVCLNQTAPSSQGSQRRGFFLVGNGLGDFLKSLSTPRLIQNSSQPRLSPLTHFPQGNPTRFPKREMQERQYPVFLMTHFLHFSLDMIILLDEPSPRHAIYIHTYIYVLICLCCSQ